MVNVELVQSDLTSLEKPVGSSPIAAGQGILRAEQADVGNWNWKRDGGAELMADFVGCHLYDRQPRVIALQLEAVQHDARSRLEVLVSPLYELLQSKWCDIGSCCRRERLTCQHYM